MGTRRAGDFLGASLVAGQSDQPDGTIACRADDGINVGADIDIVVDFHVRKKLLGPAGHGPLLKWSRSFEIVTNPYGGQLRVEKKDSPGAAPAYELSAENWISYSRGADGLGLVLAY